MIRRSFRAGLTLGLLSGLAFALVKMFGGDRAQQPTMAPAADGPWPRLQPDPGAGVAPPAVDPAPRAAPDPLPAPTPAPVHATLPDEPAPRAEPASQAEPASPAPPAPAPKAATPTPVAAKPAAAKPAATKKASPAKKASAPKKKAPVAAWVEAAGGVCPTSHPVKGKLASKIFHLPGMLNYDRTRADRCYRDGAAAEKDGLRPAKR